MIEQNELEALVADLKDVAANEVRILAARIDWLEDAIDDALYALAKVIELLVDHAEQPHSLAAKLRELTFEVETVEGHEIREG